MKVVKVIAAALVLAMAGAVMYRYLVLIPAARVPVLANLIDPDSARFRNDRLAGPWRVREMFYCGEVDAKDATGAYIGYRHFIADDTQSTIYPAGIVPAPMCGTRGEEMAWWWLNR